MMHYRTEKNSEGKLHNSRASINQRNDNVWSMKFDVITVEKGMIYEARAEYFSLQDYCCCAILKFSLTGAVRAYRETI